MNIGRFRIFVPTFVAVSLLLVAILLISCGVTDVVGVSELEVPDEATARVVFFRADDCEPCRRVEDDLIAPLRARCGASLELTSVDIGTDEGYEAFVTAERTLIGEAGRWEVPVVVVADAYFIGEAAISQELLSHVQCIFGAGGKAWPGVPALDVIAEDDAPAAVSIPLGRSDEVEECVEDEDAAVCESPNPVLAALYLSPADCTDTCDRTRYDLRYLQGVHPQLFIEERTIERDRALARSLADELGAEIEEDALAPAVVVGQTYLAGPELAPATLRATLDHYAETGATAIWYHLESAE